MGRGGYVEEGVLVVMVKGDSVKVGILVVMVSSGDLLWREEA